MADSRLFVGARPAGNQFRGLGRVILPVVIRDEERSITVAQLQRWIGQRIRHTKGSQAGTNASRYDSVRPPPLLWPRMKPAITMLSPVLTKARVLILASFETADGLRS